ncbi:winged helix-turn-helix transcriptional regulator [Streptomyces sp. CA-132043]|uniref:winged helix-turn-helix transcriptional regulator n=1 Tax=Streptomyces sp. CA-132043 TaxID=3240048 RepID=UPI003D92B660
MTMTAGTPGRPVRGSTTGRPVMAALDLFGRRWTLRVMWELQNGSVGFRALQQQCGSMSSSVLRQRLTELQEARLVERDTEGGYRLSNLGADACQELRGLHQWAERWAAELDTALDDTK